MLSNVVLFYITQIKKNNTSQTSLVLMLNTISTLLFLVISVISKIEVYKSLNQNSEIIHYSSQITFFLSYPVEGIYDFCKFVS